MLQHLCLTVIDSLKKTMFLQWIWSKKARVEVKNEIIDVINLMYDLYHFN